MKNNNYIVSHTSYEIINRNSKILGKRTAVTFKNINSLLRSCDIGLSTVILKKSILRKTDKFPSIKTKEDFVLWLRLLKRNNIIHGIDIKLTKWRKLENSLSSSVIQRIKDGYQVYNKYLKMNKLMSLYYLLLLSFNSVIKKIN